MNVGSRQLHVFGITRIDTPEDILEVSFMKQEIWPQMQEAQTPDIEDDASFDAESCVDQRIERLLLVCGAIKAGTTWLFSMLRQHPMIAVPKIKEVHFFAPASLPWDPLADEARIQALVNYFDNNGPYVKHAPELAEAARNDLEWFHNYLSGPIDLPWLRSLYGQAAPDHYISDFSPFTSLGDQNDVKRICDSSHNRRLIYLIRNPVDRYWSHYNFHKSLFSPGEDITGYNESFYADELAGADFALHGQYYRFIEMAQSVLEPHEFLVLPIEDCRADPLAAVRKIEAFLDLPPATYDPASLKANVFPSRLLMKPEAFQRACLPLVERDCADLDRLGVAYPETYRALAL